MEKHLVHAGEVQKFLARKHGDSFDTSSSSLISNLYSASLLVRHDIEKKLLMKHKLSWTAMLMLYTLWVWGPSETRIIAQRLQLAPSSVTSLTNTLEKKGLVFRSYKPMDRRLVLVNLASTGVSLLSTLSKEVNEREQALTSKLTQEEIDVFNQLLNKLLGRS
mgnify:FL=1